MVLNVVSNEYDVHHRKLLEFPVVSFVAEITHTLYQYNSMYYIIYLYSNKLL